MYTDVIPLLRLPKELGAFTYRVLDAMANTIQRGSFVRIPFRGRKIWGVCTRFTNDPGTTPPSRIKDLLEIRDDIALTEHEVVAIESTAQLFRHSLATTARVLLPQVPTRIVPHTPAPQRRTFRVSNTPDWTARAFKQPGDVIVIPHDHRQRMEAIRALAANAVAQRKNVLIITPHRAWLSSITRSLPHLPIATFDLAASTGSAWQAFLATRTHPIVIVGTRAAAFLAPPNLGAIILDEAHDDDLKSWDASPRYDARVIVARTAHALRIPRVIISPAPRVADWTPEARRLDLGAPETPETRVVNLHAHWKNGGRGLITDDLIDAIKESLAHRRVAVILHNRRGIAARMTCLDCQHTIACPACGSPLAEYPGGGVCTRCGTTGVTVRNCPMCHSLRLAGRGEGTVALARDIQRAFPHTRVARIDRDNPNDLPRDADIIVCTERFLDALAPSFNRPIGCVAIAHAERLVRSDDYRYNERLLQTLSMVAMWARTWQATLLIQATDPALPAIRVATGGSPLSTFYRAEIEERRALGYPPATRLISCITTSPKVDPVQPLELDRYVDAECMELRSLLAKQFPAMLIQIDGPTAVRNPKTKNNSRVIIRLAGTADDATVAAVAQYIPKLWTIDVDPIDLT